MFVYRRVSVSDELPKKQKFTSRISKVQLTKAGNFRARLRMASPTGLKHKDMCRFLPRLPRSPRKRPREYGMLSKNAIKPPERDLKNYSSWWFEPTQLKNMLVKMGIISPNRGEHFEKMKPPPSYLNKNAPHKEEIHTWCVFVFVFECNVAMCMFIFIEIPLSKKLLPHLIC